MNPVLPAGAHCVEKIGIFLYLLEVIHLPRPAKTLCIHEFVRTLRTLHDFGKGVAVGCSRVYVWIKLIQPPKIRYLKQTMMYVFLMGRTLPSLNTGSYIIRFHFFFQKMGSIHGHGGTSRLLFANAPTQSLRILASFGQNPIPISPSAHTPYQQLATHSHAGTPKTVGCKT